MKTYLVIYCGSLLLAMIATPLVAAAAKAAKIVDAPGPRKIHSGAIPRIGGVGIAVAALLMAIPVFFLDNRIGQAFHASQNQMLMLLSMAAFIFTVGLIDDLRGVNAKIKLLAQVVAAAAVCSVGIRINSLLLMDGLTIHTGILSWPLTMFWIVGLTNAVNLIDGLDGLAAGIAAIACGTIAIFAICMGQSVLAVLMLALLGSLTGFLTFNFHPAKIFMGDSGSLFLGFVLAVSSVLCSATSAALVGLALPAMALAVPIGDTLFSILRRLLERRPIFSPDRGHIHHRLLAMGLQQHQVAIFIYAITLITAALSLFMLVTRGAATLVVFGCMLLLVMLVFRMIGSVRLRESLASLRRNMELAGHAKEYLGEFAKAQLRLREALSFSQWWQIVAQAAENMNFCRVALTLRKRDGSWQTLLWHQEGSQLAKSELVSVTVPVRDRRAGPQLMLEIDVLLTDSLESAGQRVTLFSRLMDENGLASLPPQVPQAATADSDSTSVHAGSEQPVVE